VLLLFLALLFVRAAVVVTRSNGSRPTLLLLYRCGLTVVLLVVAVAAAVATLCHSALHGGGRGVCGGLVGGPTTTLGVRRVGAVSRETDAGEDASLRL
jgi:hypothetical protein